MFDGFFETEASMWAEIERAPDIYKPGEFWRKIRDRHLDLLSKEQPERFKLNISSRYFTFAPRNFDDPMFRRAIDLWPTHYNPGPLSALIHAMAQTRDEDFALYCFYTALMWEHARATDPLGLIERLEEPELGVPCEIRRHGKLVSEDLVNSYHEFCSIVEAVPEIIDGGTIAELGAGYGRLAYVFGKLTRCRYLIFDIPPALALAQHYIAALFPDDQVFRFRPFDRFRDVADELSRCRFGFFTANQMELMPDGIADVTATISTLQEMPHGQIANYLSLMQRMSGKALYIKQMWNFINGDDRIETTAERFSPSPTWREIFKRQEPIHPDFFEAAYRRS